MRRAFASLTAAVVVALQSGASTAQRRATETDDPAPEAVVSAPSRRPESLRESGRSVSADSSAEAHRALARDVGERLEEIPGVFVQRTTSASAAPLVRGVGGQRTLLLFDGLRLNDSLTRVGGNALLSLVDPSVVQRVEVLRGPASVLYGSDALGGVVAVVPTDAWPRPDGASGARVEAGLRAASAERALQSTVLAEGESGAFGLLASGAVGRAGRTLAGGGAELPYSGYDDRAVSVRGTTAPSQNHRVGLALHTSALIDVPRPDTSLEGDLRSYRHQQRDLGYLWWQGSRGPARFTARAGWMRREEIRDRVRGTRLDAEYDVVHTLHVTAQAELRWRGASVTFGFDAARDHVASRTETVRDRGAPSSSRGRYIDGSRYLTGGLFALWQQRLGSSGRWRFELGSRLSLVSAQAPSDAEFPAFDTVLAAPVASAGLWFSPGAGVALMANVLRGFRAPNLDDWQALGSGARSYDVPNPALGPARSWSAVLGVRVDRGGLGLTAFAYGSALSGLVARVPSTFNGMTLFDGRRVYTRANASDGYLAGAEVDLVWRARVGLRVAVGASATWAEATLPLDDGSSVREPLAKVPPPFGRASVGWRWPRAWADVVFTGALAQTRLAASDRDDVRLCPDGPDRCTEVPGYGVVALRAGVVARPGVTVAVAVENLFDNRYTAYSGGQFAPGRNVMTLLRFATR